MSQPATVSVQPPDTFSIYSYNNQKPGMYVVPTLVSLIVDHMLIFFFVNFSLPICLIKDYAYITCDKFLTLCFYCDYYAYIEI